MARADTRSLAERFKIALEEVALAALASASEAAAFAMKEKLSKTVYSGKLHDSVTYAVSPARTHEYLPLHKTSPGNPSRKMVGEKGADVVITPETRPLSAKVGTADPKAKYVEYGTGPHTKKEGSEHFIKEITEWGEAHGFDEQGIILLIKAIRERGTDSHPFIQSGKKKAEAVLRVALPEFFTIMLKKMPKKVQTIDPNGITTTVTVGGGKTS